MKSILKKYRFDGIWHFTDRSNLKLIGELGLLSLAEAERRGVEIPSPGGNDWSHDADRAKGLHEFVHLAFVDDHPMLYYARSLRRRNSRLQIRSRPRPWLINFVEYMPIFASIDQPRARRYRIFAFANFYGAGS